MIYLDSAATTFQKPPAVEAAMVEALRTMSSPGRGGYPAALAAADAAFDCRSALAELYGLKNPEQVVFTANATHALNIAIKTLVSPGGRVAISGYEHNAVTRPLAALEADVRIADLYACLQCFWLYPASRGHSGVVPDLGRAADYR